MNKLLTNLFYNLESPVAFGSRDNLYKEARKRNKKLTRKDVISWLDAQLPYTLHKPARVNFKTRSVVVYDIDEQWQMDLVDLSKLSKFNDNYKYLLVIIDVFSKSAWVEPLKAKNAKDLKKAMEKVFKESKRQPKLIQTDKGTEFLNVPVKSLLAERNIKLFTTNSERKASIVERLNRTLKGIMFRYMTHTNQRRYIDVLPQLVSKYNNTYHRSIKMKPLQVTSANSPQVWINLYENKQLIKKNKSKLKIGDKVRISFEKKIFQKRYEELWTEEIFIITNVINGNPTVYKLKDLANESLKGTFYSHELQKVIDSGTYRIEKVIRKRKAADGSFHYFVKWKGYPEKFNSFVSETDIEKL